MRWALIDGQTDSDDSQRFILADCSWKPYKKLNWSHFQRISRIIFALESIVYDKQNQADPSLTKPNQPKQRQNAHFLLDSYGHY